MDRATKKQNLDRGFTLIELLVVIAIIGVLSAVVLGSLRSAGPKTRDAERLRELHEMDLALQLYFAKYGTYPATGVAPCNSANDAWCLDAMPSGTKIANWIPGLQEFMREMPHNPKPYAAAPGNSPYQYISPSRDQFWLVVTLENGTQKASCGGGRLYTWFDGTDVCGENWWGPGAVSVFSK